MNRIPIGLDLSLTSTGVSGNGVNAAIMTPTKGPERLHLIALMVLDHFRNTDNPVAVIEGYSFASRNSQAHSIGELGGVIRVELWRNNIPYVEVAPTARAKFATGKGNASKVEVMSAVSARTGKVWSGSAADDMCDAWVLEEMALTAMGSPRYEWPKQNLSALEAINWDVLRSIDE